MRIKESKVNEEKGGILITIIEDEWKKKEV